MRVYGLGAHLVDFEPHAPLGCGVHAPAARGVSEAHDVPAARGEIPFETSVVTEGVFEYADVLAVYHRLFGDLHVVVRQRH